MKYVRLIFGGKVLNYERHLTYFQFLIFKKIIESSLKDLNYIHVTKLAQEQAKKFGWMENHFLYPLKRIFSIHCLGSRHWHILGLILVNTRASALAYLEHHLVIMDCNNVMDYILEFYTHIDANQEG